MVSSAALIYMMYKSNLLISLYIILVCCQPTELIWDFVFINFPIYPPPPRHDVDVPIQRMSDGTEKSDLEGKADSQKA
mgnify:CR=1 FL=1